MRKGDAALLNDLPIGRIGMTGKGENMSFDVPCKDGAFANPPK